MSISSKSKKQNFFLKKYDEYILYSYMRIIMVKEFYKKFDLAISLFSNIGCCLVTFDEKVKHFEPKASISR